MAAVPEATVVIVNPTHYAVALKYESGKMAAPVCVAKGVDLVALRIREVAKEHDVPIVENPPLARALYASVVGRFAQGVKPMSDVPAAALCAWVGTTRARMRMCPMPAARSWAAPSRSMQTPHKAAMAGG